ncbi:MAG: periplasmic heavy metal sensor [Syntrophobacteraceae bacterium]
MLKPALVVAVFLLMGTNAGAFGGPCVIGRGAGPDPSVASALRLSEDQIAVIGSLHETFEEEFRPLQNQLLSKKGELAQLWAKTDPDQARIAAKEVEIRDIRGRIQEISTFYHLKCRQMLSPEQRKILSTLSNQYGGSRRGRPWVSYGW